MLTTGCMIKLQMTGLFMLRIQENNVRDCLTLKAEKYDRFETERFFDVIFFKDSRSEYGSVEFRLCI